jgi:Mg2+-importing ATPase
MLPSSSDRRSGGSFFPASANPLVIILLVASGLSAATGDVASFLIVVTIVTISMTIDFVQEVRAQNAVEAIRRSVAVHATARRDDTSVSIPLRRFQSGRLVELMQNPVASCPDPAPLD